MKKTFHCMIAILTMHCMQTISAQTKYDEFPEIKRINDDAHLTTVIQSDGTGIYAFGVKGRGKAFYFEKFTKEGKNIFSAELKSEPEPVSILSAKSIRIFTKRFDAKAMQRYLTCTEYSSETGSVISETDVSGLKAYIYGGDGTSFKMKLSPDKSKLIIVAQSTWNGKPDLTLVQLYDASNMKKLWEKDFDNSYGKYVARINSFYPDNDGNMLAEITYGQSIITIEKGDRNYGLALLKSADKTLTTIDIKGLGNNGIVSYKIRMNNDPSATLFGIYKSSGKESSPKEIGIFKAVISMKNAEFGNVVLSPFTSEANTKLTYGREDPADKQFVASAIMEMDGTIYFIAEQHFTKENNSNMSFSVDKELLISKMKQTGEVEWMKVIPKSTFNTYAASEHGEPSLSNYHFFVSNKKLNFIYLDHPKNSKNSIDNYEPGNISAVEAINGTNVTLVSVDASGNVKKEILHENKDFCEVPMNENIMLDSSTLLIYIKKGSHEKFGSVKVQ